MIPTATKHYYSCSGTANVKKAITECVIIQLIVIVEFF